MTEGDPARVHETQSAADTAQPAGEAGSHLLRDRPQRYQVIAEHGRGGLGRVSRALDRDLERDVAIKELLVRTPHAEARFLREAMITARLEHPGVVPVHEVGRWPDGTPYYAMKLVSGRPLRALIAELATVPQRLTLLHHVVAVADAIAYAHGRGIIHRDLKPANVIVGEFGETIVIDWGLAKDLHAGDHEELRAHALGSPDPELTKTGAVLGTPAYMPPEQERGEHVDQRADVFAIGAMLWELCSLDKVPPADLALRHRMLARAGIDRDLVEILDKALAADAARRYPDAGALAADLKAFTSGARIAARDYSLLAMIGHWTRRHRSLAAGIAAFALVVIASVIALAVLYGDAEHNAAVARANADTAKQRLVQSYIEQGRRLSLDGDYLRALPYLSEAYTLGDRSTALRFLLARAEQNGASLRASYVQGGVARAAAFRRDGHTAISVSENGEAAVWDTSTGKLVSHLRGRSEAKPGRQYPRVTRDGALAAIPTSTGVVLWDGTQSHTISVDAPQRLAFDADGARIAIASKTELSAWDTRQRLRLWTAHLGRPLIQLAWQGDSVIALGVDQRVRRLRDGAVQELEVANAGTFATGRHRLAIVVGQAVELWRDDTRQFVIGGQGSSVTAIAFSRDEAWLAIGADDGSTRVIRCEDGSTYATLAGHRGRVQALELDARGTQLASAAADLTVRVWDLRDRHLAGTLLGMRDPPVVGAMRFDDDGRRLLVPTEVAIRVFAAQDAARVAVVVAAEEIRGGRFLEGSQELLTASDRRLQRWSLATAQPVASYVANGPVIAIDAKGEKFASVGGPDTTDVSVYDTKPHRIRARVRAQARVLTVTFNNASSMFATGEGDGTIELWDTNGARVAMLRGRDAWVKGLGFSPDDRHLVSGDAEGTATIWDLRTHTAELSMRAGRHIMSASFDASGTQILTSSDARIVQLWNAQTATLARIFEAPNAIHHATINGDGTLVAGAAIDGSIEVWDVATASLIAMFDQATRASYVEFGRNVLFSASENGHATIWRTDLESRPPDAVAAFARCHAPYKLVETRLEPAEPVCDALAAAMLPAR